MNNSIKSDKVYHKRRKHNLCENVKYSDHANTDGVTQNEMT